MKSVAFCKKKDWSGLVWTGVDWSGLEWTGVECTGFVKDGVDL